MSVRKSILSCPRSRTSLPWRTEGPRGSPRRQWRQWMAWAIGGRNRSPKQFAGTNLETPDLWVWTSQLFQFARCSLSGQSFRRSRYSGISVGSAQGVEYLTSNLKIMSRSQNTCTLVTCSIEDTRWGKWTIIQPPYVATVIEWSSRLSSWFPLYWQNPGLCSAAQFVEDG